MSLVVKRFTATWCNPCSTLAPIMMTVQIKNPTVQFQTIDVDEQTDIATQYGIRSVPTVLIEKNGDVVQTIIGAQFESVYMTAISKWK